MWNYVVLKLKYHNLCWFKNKIYNNQIKERENSVHMEKEIRRNKRGDLIFSFPSHPLTPRLPYPSHLPRIPKMQKP